ncbi:MULTISPECIES: short-chain dehydrogenase [Heyndrickxia]|uniref:Short-chain dehydrogenase n=3 Tax=Heyndrickxia TaxID=2837504 RepID=A0AB37HHM8_9BACI|nr:MULTISPECIES: short-chain dehydrogenase [Heyndrickxia]MBL5768337.1 short-chain dehydrogenase [Heyndrickxia sporothermodurans]MBL5771988.1 short-chain dehydrogenase [Heyndrickxia sporothermodurans]MBL5775596.1 short-chain dehydrogenase [Heyndrickxia sporothermodurans]MBL5779127.1 short-chain dehydrogenase [Heyndrickxia sporothermodurans]MBL5783295.1 short-chain dehydrogenase [Heyndrickxia sporothermodurans]
MKHALVVGGTGMLSNTSLWLMSKGYQVSVIGRNVNRMEGLISRSIDRSLIIPILVDYSDVALLKRNLRQAIERNGPIELVIAWIHSYAENALEIISKEVSHWNEGTWSLFHVLGSSRNLSEIKSEINVFDSCRYHQVQVGFVIENGHSRWLTNEEISQGVIDSVQNDKLTNIIGTLEPWEKRPLA